MPNYQTFSTWDDVPIIMDLALACRIVGKSYENLKKLSQQGKFPAYKEGKLWRVEKETLRAYIDHQYIMANEIPVNKKQP